VLDATSLERLAVSAKSDGELQLNARGWTGSVELSSPDGACSVVLTSGVVTTVVATRIAGPGPGDVRVNGTAEMWNQLFAPVPPAPFTDPFGGIYGGMTITGGPFSATRHLAIRRLVELARHAVNGTDPTPAAAPSRARHGEFDAATGRYVHLELEGLDHRVYFEEAGKGIGLLCQHTAGADGRQWRHLLEDRRITDRFHVVVYDLPYHGKSLPPSGRAWWAEAYLLTRDRAMAVPRALAAVLGLDRPVFVGSSVGGMLALDLARYFPDDFRAVIACEAALHLGGAGIDEVPVPEEASLAMDVATDPALHGASMMSWMGATAPEAYRQETRFHYAQGAPGVFSGDIFYFGTDHDLSGQGALIDTSKCAVHLLTGEYDFVTLPASEIAAREIPGATYEVMSGMGHFPMSEDPDRFADYILPLLDRIAEAPDVPESSR
jgi:pimeloyl-ACP methyl ester carboxylesterase